MSIRNLLKTLSASLALGSILSMSACSSSSNKDIATLPANITTIDQLVSYFQDLMNSSAKLKAAGGQVYQQGDYVGIVVPSDSLFEINSADLLPQSKFILNDVANILLKYPKSNILVTANTDGMSTQAYEKQLSASQAEQVVGYLRTRGIGAGEYKRELKFAGLGDSQPVSDSHTPSGQAENRRIQISVFPQAKLVEAER